MRRIGRTSWGLAAAGLLLAVVLLIVAEPAEVLALARHARWRGLLVALAGTALLTALRGARLAVLTRGAVGFPRATAAAAAAQLATGVLPLRLGELAMIPLLSAAGLPGSLRALSVLVLARVLDVVAVLIWTTVAAASFGGHPAFGLALLALLAAALAAAWIATARAMRRIARRWRHSAGWRVRALRQLLRARRELAALVRSPVRAGAAVVLSVAAWAVIWAVTVALLRAMGLVWPLAPVLLGVLGAAFGSALPIGSVGSFGNQEAGWVAALAAAGVEARTALAAGFACHLWSLVFAAALGAGGLLYLSAARREPSARPLRAVLRSFLSSERRP